ncbi:toxin-antitoxin system YwqK family antitoxin [Nocardia sp. NPDC058519]|uniref:toxin-antitoxin system YwqK family antitoxin n=1 Tax=Nocardia sp. NPDC058519 TaxID=3346535 RepID=UPI003652F18C
MAVSEFADDFIDRDDPGVAIDRATGRLSYRGVPFSGYVEVGVDGGPREFWSYSDGDRDGLWSGTYFDGAKRYEGLFHNNLPLGKWEEWYRSGRLRRVDVYDRDDGLESSVVYDEQGRVIEIWDELTRKGIPRDAIDSGDPLLSIDWAGVAEYEGAPLTGAVIERIGSTGPVVSVETFVGGRRDGPSRAWHGDGSVRSIGQFSKGRAVGTWLAYDGNGTLVGETVFSPGGGIASKRAWDESGRLIDGDR